MKPEVGIMSKSLCLLTIFCIMMLMGGCATTSSLMSPMPSDVKTVEPNPGESLVVFMRPSTYGGAVQSTVFDITDGDNKFIGVVSAKTMVSYHVSSGKRMFMVIGESADFLEANLNPDLTYYALVRPRMGVWKARFSLSPIRRADLDGEEFRNWYDKCQYMSNTDASFQWARENADSINKKKEKYLPVWQSKPEDSKREATLFDYDGI